MESVSIEFERLLCENRASVERFVRFRLPSYADADDILQEVYLAAFLGFHSLKSGESFKPWIIGIAKNKCNDWFRKKAKEMEIPMESVGERTQLYGGRGRSDVFAVQETMHVLANKDRQILYLYFWEQLPQNEIAERLHIPLGTVKSRLYTAKQNFKKHYPYRTSLSKGEIQMNKLPKILPSYKIEKLDEKPFSFRHEELPSMLIVPRKGEKLTFGTYDLPERRLGTICQLEVIGDVVLHGVRGVEIRSRMSEKEELLREWSIFAQLTDTHCRYLGGAWIDNSGTRRVLTFLDGEEFAEAYEIGEENCGFPIDRKRTGAIQSCGGALVTGGNGDVSDVLARYRVTINGKCYDTVQLIDIQTSKKGNMMCEYYLDENGKTVLCRRFNQNTWAFGRYQKKWIEMLPDSEQVIIDGEIYVHWYDTITDYIL